MMYSMLIQYAMAMLPDVTSVEHLFIQLECYPCYQPSPKEETQEKVMHLYG